MTDSPAPPGIFGRRKPGRAAAWTVSLCGVLISTLLAAYIAYWEHRGIQEEARELAAERTELLASTMRVSMQVLYSLQSLHEATGRIDASAFVLFARDARSRHPELQALEWAPRIIEEKREAFEVRMRQEGFPAFQITEISANGILTAAGRRPTYFPVQLIEPLGGNERAQGLDLAQDQRRRAALDRALATRLPAATAPIRLAQVPGDQPGFLVFLPLYGKSLSPRDSVLEGFALAVFRFDDLIRHAMRDMDGRGIAFSIDDVGEQPAHRVFGDAATQPAARLPDWLAPVGPWHGTLDIAGRQWQLNFAPESGFLSRHLPWQTLATFVVGLLITALAAASVRLLARRSAEVARVNTALRLEVAQRERAVEAAQAASQSKSSFLANMSHEIRTPMNAVLGYAQLLRRDDRLDLEQREAVNAIVSSGSHLMAQINEVLDFSKIESGKLELNRSDFDLNGILRDLARMFQPRCQEKSLALTVGLLAREEAFVHGDGVKLQQILINLLGNAVRFTSVGEIALRTRKGNDQLYSFDVIDTGPGIAQEENERIFEPFYQARALAAQGGSGLGLAIARRQAEAMGGTLTVRCEPGSGAVFTLRLPLPAAARSVGEGRGTSRWKLAQGESLKLLVVDDIATNRDVLAKLLLEARCEAVTAGDAKTAMQLMSSESYDAVFLDMRMPDIDGMTALAMIRSRAPEARVVAYTAAAFAQDQARFVSAGCDGVVTKPIDIDQLFGTLTTVCGSRFNRETIASEDEQPLREPDYSRLLVSQALLQRMMTAAELHSATVLKACLEELSAEGHEQRLLAQHLRQHLRAYDMNAISRLLMQVSEAPGSQVGQS